MKKEYVKFFKKNSINSYSKYKLFNDKFKVLIVILNINFLMINLKHEMIMMN